MQLAERMAFVEPSDPIWIQPPESDIPVPVAVVRTLARVPGAALTLTRVDAYRDGIMMHLRVDLLLEDGVKPQRESEIRRFLDSTSRSRPCSDDQIALSVTYPDGSRAEAMGPASTSLRALNLANPG